MERGAVRCIAWLDLTRDIGTVCSDRISVGSACNSDGDENAEEHTTEQLLHADREQEWVTLHRQWTLDERDDVPADSGCATDE